MTKVFAMVKRIDDMRKEGDLDHAALRPTNVLPFFIFHDVAP